MSRSIVSVIVPTKNSEGTLERCLKSVRAQTYSHIELIVVDNHSTDRTQALAERYADKVLVRGPERSAQVNYGVEKSSGAYIYKVDSDFVLDKTVVEECMQKAAEGYDAVVVHNSPDESIGWIAKLRKFEVDMYKYDLTYSSARFVKKTLYKKIGGFDPEVTAGEDYDFQNKLNRAGARVGFIDAEALHLGEPRSLRKHLMKYYAYGKDFVNYTRASTPQETSAQLGFARPVYIRNWRKFIRHPITGAAFICYHTLKFAFGGAGYMVARLHR